MGSFGSRGRLQNLITQTFVSIIFFLAWMKSNEWSRDGAEFVKRANLCPCSMLWDDFHQYIIVCLLWVSVCMNLHRYPALVFFTMSCYLHLLAFLSLQYVTGMKFNILYLGYYHTNKQVPRFQGGRGHCQPWYCRRLLFKLTERFGSHFMTASGGMLTHFTNGSPFFATVLVDTVLHREFFELSKTTQYRAMILISYLAYMYVWT